MTVLYRILLRLGILWTGLIVLLWIIANIVSSITGTRMGDAHLLYILVVLPGLAALALAWVIKPAE